MASAILWFFAILGGGIGVLILVLFGLEMWAEKQQRDGKNPFR